MRAISLWQPWATAIAVGVKRVETRHWPTNHTGPLAIHAAKHWTISERRYTATARELWSLGGIPLSFGAIVATCTLMGCRRTEDVELQLSEIERFYGNYAPGRFAWFLTDIVALSEPIPFKGHQGFFNVPDELLNGPATG